MPRPALVPALLLSACLLPSPPAAPRFYAPGDPVALREAGTTAAPVAAHLAPVRSPVHLREAMTWRRSDVEYGFYEQRRWTELPSAYVERALAGELFAVEGAAPTDGAAPLVTAEVLAFEAVLEPSHLARVAVAIIVVDGRCARLRQTFEATRPLAGDDGATIARGIGEALNEVARTAGDAIRRALARRGAC